MTEEEREKAQEQLAALTQAYSELSQHCSDQTTAAEEVGRLTCQLENSATCWPWCMTNRFLFPCNELSSAASVFVLEQIQTQYIHTQVCCKHALLCPALI